MATLVLGFLVASVGLLVGASPVSADLSACVHATEQEDWAAALQECRPLAAQGSAEAQFFVGFMYANGRGLPQDLAEAVRWYRRAAEQGDVAAQFALGVAYLRGQGVPQDYAEAVDWYRRAAEQGDPEAQINLGGMFGAGQGVPQDYVSAHMWYNIAASRLQSGAARDMAVKNRDLIAGKMTPAQVAEAQRLAREWALRVEGPR